MTSNGEISRLGLWLLWRLDLRLLCLTPSFVCSP